MEKCFCYWQDEEVKTLFKFVEVKKSEGKPLIKIFNEFAKMVGRQQNSVRNYYYNEIKNLQNDEKRKKMLGVNLNLHLAKKPQHFSKLEEKNILNKINELINKGYSVRRACLTLAGGDATKMIRYQNKYRTSLKQNNKGEQMGTIIKMPERKTIMNDEDIKALFMGLVKLVKKQEQTKAKDEFETALTITNEKLRNAMNEIILKTEKIEKLQSQINLLKYELEKSKDIQIKKRVSFVRNETAKNLIDEFISKKDVSREHYNQNSI